MLPRFALSGAVAALVFLLVRIPGQAQSPPPAEAIASAEKTQAIETLQKELRNNYVFPEKANQVADMLQAHIQAHEYDNITEGGAFAQLLTEQIHALCQDAHLRVHFSAKPLPVRQQSNKPTADEMRQRQTFVRSINGGVEKVERLAGNIGYFELRGFFEPEASAQPIRAAMDLLANTDALIIDLRRNGGGDPDTVRLLCSYLFDTKPVHINDLYFRQGNHTMQFWTLAHVPGHRYLNRDVYVLMSKRTGSGAEEFCYDLQGLKRATLIGSATWGGANPGSEFRLTDHISAFIPGGRAINPYTHTNWEGTGVQPDIAVPAEQALEKAHLLALNRLLDRATDPDEKERLTQAMKDAEATYHGAEAGAK